MCVDFTNLKRACPKDSFPTRRSSDLFFQVGAQIPILEKEQLVDLLRRNVDVFAGDAYETLGQIGRAHV